MDDLILRYLQNQISAAEERDLERWRQSSAANEDRFRELSELWSLTGLAAPAPLDTPPPPASEIIRRAHGSDLLPLPVQARRRALRFTPGRWAAAAAVLVLAFGWMAGQLISGREQMAQSAPFAPTEYSTSSGERATARLPDGTIVRLAPSSRLLLLERPGVRQVSLDGEAFFAVAANPALPFVIQTSAGEARVVGTRFGLRATNGALRVVVVEGRVTVKVGEHETPVDPGEMALANDGAEPALVRVSDIRSLLEWMGQSLVFQETPLARAIPEIEELYGARIQVQSEEILDRTITAWFTDQAFDEVMAVVCRVAQLRCSVGPLSADLALAPAN